MSTSNMHNLGTNVGKLSKKTVNTYLSRMINTPLDNLQQVILFWLAIFNYLICRQTTPQNRKLISHNQYNIYIIVQACDF